MGDDLAWGMIWHGTPAADQTLQGRIFLEGLALSISREGLKMQEMTLTSVLLRSLKLNGVSHKAKIEEVKKIRSWHHCTLIALVMVSFLQIAKCYAVK